MVIGIEMPKVHSQTLTCGEYHKSSQRKREEPFKTFTQLLAKTHRTKRMILHQKQNFLCNQATHYAKRAFEPYITPDQQSEDLRGGYLWQEEVI